MTWYCSWYFPLKSKLFLSKKLWWRFYLAISSLSLRPVQIIQNASHQSIRQLNSPTKRFQNVGSICPNNSFRYIYMSSVDHTISLTCSTFLIRVSYKRFGLPTGYFTENCLVADDAPNVNGWFPTSFLTFSGIFLWSTMWFIDFVYSKP